MAPSDDVVHLAVVQSIRPREAALMIDRTWWEFWIHTGNRMLADADDLDAAGFVAAAVHLELAAERLDRAITHGLAAVERAETKPRLVVVPPTGPSRRDQITRRSPRLH